MNVTWAISTVLIAMFGLIAVGHACCLVRFLVKGTNFSVVPLVGGILGGAGFFWHRTRPCDTFGGYLHFLIMVLFRV